MVKASPVIAKADKVVDITPVEAEKAPLGKDKYRVIGLLDKFGVQGQKGKKVLVKGLLIDDPKEKRINMTSFIGLEAACN